ncbi:MAG: hypothetical protein KTU85_06060 [Acidimicrobiia bacterium]|nr:hypothetical protein [Acidimicrobiia bacterium]MCY4457014.1 hypothetical protein [Acidimicrobiaceae bacterium]
MFETSEREFDLRRQYWWVAGSLVVYVILGVWLKSIVLNWIVGPLWLFVTAYWLPKAFSMLRSFVFDR